MIPTPCAFSSRMTRKRLSTSWSLSEAVGSSMIRMRASAPRARAISTSCCSGIVSRRTSVSGSIAAPIRSSSRRARSRRSPQRTRRQAPPRLQAERDVLGDGQVGEERRLLVDRGDPERAGADAGRCPRPLGRGPRASPRRARCAPVMTLMSVDLPAPFSPTSAWTSPRAEVEGDAPQRLDAGEGLLHAPGREQDLRHAR